MENEENKIEEKIETSAVAHAESSVQIPKKKRRFEFLIELALFFILGILVGIAIKSEALKRISIGFDDYKMKIENQDYDINKLELQVTAKEQERAQEQDGEGENGL